MHRCLFPFCPPPLDSFANALTVRPARFHKVQRTTGENNSSFVQTRYLVGRGKVIPLYCIAHPYCARFQEHVFAKNSLIKNIFEEEEKFDSGTRYSFLENGYQLGVFWPRRGLQAHHGTVRKSAIFPQASNQKQLKWSNTAYVNKWSFAFKIKLCVFQVTKTSFCMKVIRIFNAQPVKRRLKPKITHFKSPLTRRQARWPHFLLHF